MIYKSNLTAPDLQPLFIYTAAHEGAHSHSILHDVGFDVSCGYMSHDEAAILHNIAKLNPGRWLEIGSHTGWSGAHVAIADLFIDMLDPAYQDLRFLQRTVQNLHAVGVAGFCRLIPLTSDRYWHSPDHGKRKYTGVIIDGNHDAPYPERDAISALPWLEENAVVFFHDFCGRPIRDGVRFLINQGFKFRVYNTPQMLGVCYRGNITLPVHVPDPAVDWKKRRAQYPDFNYQGEL